MEKIKYKPLQGSSIGIKLCNLHKQLLMLDETIRKPQHTMGTT